MANIGKVNGRWLHAPVCVGTTDLSLIPSRTILSLLIAISTHRVETDTCTLNEYVDIGLQRLSASHNMLCPTEMWAYVCARGHVCVRAVLRSIPHSFLLYTSDSHSTSVVVFQHLVFARVWQNYQWLSLSHTGYDQRLIASDIVTNENEVLASPSLSIGNSRAVH